METLIEDYKEQFEDIICRLDEFEDVELHAKAMIQGFELAIMSTLRYHEDCLKTYKMLHAEYLGIKR